MGVPAKSTSRTSSSKWPAPRVVESKAPSAPVTPTEVALTSALHEVVHMMSTNFDERRPIPRSWLPTAEELAQLPLAADLEPRPRDPIGYFDFTGPVHDAQHGVEPMSRGAAYLRPPQATAWRVRPARPGADGGADRDPDGGWQPARIRWLAHGIEPESRRLWLRYEVAAAVGSAGMNGATRIVTEWPEHVIATDGSKRIGLERRFATSGNAALALALVVPNPAGDSSNGAASDGNGLLVLSDEPASGEVVITPQATREQGKNASLKV